MSQIFYSEEMRKLEQEEFQKKNSYYFMKRAGAEVYKFINDNFKNKPPIIVLCGPGNNGGDGLIIANHLMHNGYSVEVYVFSRKEGYKGDALKRSKTERFNLASTKLS